ncbi:MAG TPA: serine hydrolase [Gemmatimonas sp.]|nr:serine hydrolase [Gemmatimonas sp.]
MSVLSNASAGRRGFVRAALLVCTVTGPSLLDAQSRGAPAGRSAALYYPDAGRWERRTPSQVGLDSTKLAAAIAFAIAGESKAPRDLELNHYQSFGREPFGAAIGPIAPRGDATGVIVRRGYVVAEWGDPTAVEMTHSVTKSMLSTVAGLAVDDGLIRSVHDTVSKAVGPILTVAPSTNGLAADNPAGGRWITPFASPHNRRLTWDHLLRQTSDWEGTLWGKPEWADRPTGAAATWATRPRVEPGTVYEYNDVRVNALALALLNVWRRPLPEVLKDRIMDPIGASSSWRWYGYDNAWIILDGRMVQSVSGGGHWGGGLFINARDMARFGLLTLRRGQWKDKRLLSDAWVSQALTPTPAQPTYGYMNWFLNTDRKYYASAPATAFVHVGNGTNIIYVDPENDIVAVVRWIENGAIDGFMQRLLAARTP